MELKPTLEYVALNGSAFVVLGSGAVVWSGALALGVHFNFAKPPPSTAGVASASRGQ